MRPVSRMKPGMTVRKLVLERLHETKHSTAELAEVLELPVHYVTELMSGRRRPPQPSRTDVYDKMTRFLRLGRNDLADCATAERAETAVDKRLPLPQVREQILALCDADTADALKRRAPIDDAEIVDLIGRVLGVVQGNARRSLDAQIPLRIAATRNGTTYAEARLHVLEFLDTVPGTLTLEHLIDFIRPQIANWDVDSQSGVLRVVLRPASSPERHRRRPLTNTGHARLAG